MNHNTQRILTRLFAASIRSRGKRYFKNGTVKNVQIEKNFVSVNIKGTKNYYAFITFNNNLEPQKMSCPYFETDNCKHLASLVFYLDNVGFFGPPKDEKIDLLFEQNNVQLKDKIYSIESYRKSEFLKRSLKPFIAENEREEKKSDKVDYKHAYSIFINGSRTGIFPVRMRLKKDGSIGNISRARKINFDTTSDLNLNEKLIVEYLCGYDNDSVYLGSYYNSQNDRNRRQIFNEILTFLSEKEVYLEYEYSDFKSVDVISKAAESKLLISENGDDLVLELSINLDGKVIINPQDIKPVLDKPLWIYSNDKIFKVNNLAYEQLKLFRESSFKKSISKKYLDVFEKDFLPKIASKLPIVSDKYTIEEVRLTPVKKLFLDEDDSSLIMKVKFGYDEVDFDYNPAEEFTSVYSDGKIKTIYRDEEFEEDAVEEIKNLYVKKIVDGTFTPKKDPLVFLLKHFDYFKDKGFEIFGESKLKKFKVNRSKPKVSFNVTSGIDWFDVTTEIKYDGTTVPFSELVAAIKEKKKYLKLSDGSSGILPDEWVKRFKQTLSFGKLEKDGVRFSKIQALALESILEEADDFETDEQFKEHAEKLKSFDKIKKQSIPRSFNGKLRDYQKAGVDWLYFLKEYSFGGILADDMGLGKTIQSIILLLKEKKENENYTNLIVAPTSVIFNWIDEINKFAPILKVLNQTGIQR